MIRLKSRIGIIVGLLCIAVLAVLFAIHSKPVHAMLVDYSNMEQIAPSVYTESIIGTDKKQRLLDVHTSSEERIAAVFGEKSSTSKIIYVESNHGLRKYAENPTGQTYYYPWQNYIVIGPQGFNADVLSHELTHSELRERLHNKDKVPVWFDEGLASMVDGRFPDSKAVWERMTSNGKVPVNYDLLNTHQSFGYGTEQSRNNYNLACYEVTRWYTLSGQAGLIKLIEGLNAGADFAEIYEWIEKEAEESAG